jgi:hypothetical protein
MWFRRTVMMTAAVLVVAAIGMSPAQAGGPTSVLLSAPNVPKVVAAGYDDKVYAELMQLTDPANGRGIGDANGNDDAGTFIRATWLIHDMRIWRLDMIYPDAPGGPWIATAEDTKGTGVMPEQLRWHRATDPTKLVKLLGGLGLLGGAGKSVNLPTTAPGNAPAEPVQQPAAQPPTEVVKADPGSFSGWRWSIPGFVLGAVIAIVAVRLLPKRRQWELVDVE